MVVQVRIQRSAIRQFVVHTDYESTRRCGRLLTLKSPRRNKARQGEDFGDVSVKPGAILGLDDPINLKLDFVDHSHTKLAIRAASAPNDTIMKYSVPITPYLISVMIQPCP